MELNDWFDAVAEDNIDLVAQGLSTGGIDVNAVDATTQSALHIAAKNGLAEMTEFLIESGADFSSTNKASETPAMTALAYGQPTVLQVFINKNTIRPVDHSKKEQDTILREYSEALKKNDLAKVKRLLDLGVSVNANISSSFTNYGRTHVFQALAYNKQWGIIKELLSRGADVPQSGVVNPPGPLRNKNINPPLIYAAISDQTEIYFELKKRYNSTENIFYVSEHILTRGSTFSNNNLALLNPSPYQQHCLRNATNLDIIKDILSDYQNTPASKLIYDISLNRKSLEIFDLLDEIGIETDYRYCIDKGYSKKTGDIYADTTERIANSYISNGIENHLIELENTAFYLFKKDPERFINACPHDFIIGAGSTGSHKILNAVLTHPASNDIMHLDINYKDDRNWTFLSHISKHLSGENYDASDIPRLVSTINTALDHGIESKIMKNFEKKVSATGFAYPELAAYIEQKKATDAIGCALNKRNKCDEDQFSL